MGKKKLSLKPVQRGFATTSVPKKAVQVEEDHTDGSSSDTKVSTEDQASSTKDTNGSHKDGGDSKMEQGGPTKDVWDDDAAIEQQSLQGLVERLHEKGEKEIARIIKAIDYDKRFSMSFPELKVNQSIRDRILTLAIEEDRPEPTPSSLPSTTDVAITNTEGVAKLTVSPIRFFTPQISAAETDKLLMRLYVAYGVLRELGFKEERIEQCLLEGLAEGEGWEEALQWMWLHLSEDECLQRGAYAQKEEPTLSEPDAPLIDVGNAQLESTAKPTPAQPSSNTDPTPAVSDGPNGSSASITEPSSLFQSLDDTSISESEESESNSEPDLNKANESWAKLMLELDGLRAAASNAAGAGSGAKGKGKKKGGGGVVMETPEIVKLKGRITKIEKEYMFSRKAADVIFKALKAKRDSAAIEARLKDVRIDTPPSTQSGPQSEEPSQPETEAEDEGGMFGAMLDEPTVDSQLTTQEETNANTKNTRITIRPMPILKQFSFTGNLPKAVLRTLLSKSSKQAVITYARLSNSRAARAGVEIRWSTDRRRVWKMDDVACESMDEAENYISTVALNELCGNGEVVGVNWRAMPPSYRDLWEELELGRKEKEDRFKRESWGRIKAILEKKTKPSKEATTTDIGVVKGTGLSAPSTNIPTRSTTPVFSEQLQSDFERRRSSAAYINMKEQRDTLPIAPFRNDIVSALENSQVLVFSGETGCGKSTQLPSFILENELSNGRPCKIFVTEPRRISAISLAQRVSQELGDPPGVVGTNSSLVGYSIRLEAKISASTRLAFVTNGIALRMLEAGSSGSNGVGSGKSTAFDEVTHIIVDEVHERSIDSDFLLIVLKSLLEVRKDLKVVLMSATVDADKISNFFGGCPTLSVPGRTFPVDVRYLEDAIELTGWNIDESSGYAVRGNSAKAGGGKQIELDWNEESVPAEDEALDEDEETTISVETNTNFSSNSNINSKSKSTTTSNTSTSTAKDNSNRLPSSRYSVSTVNTLNLLDSRQIPYDLIVRLLESICFDPKSNLARYSQATLVFMPGLAEIRRLNDLLQGHPEFGGSGFMVYPLHSSISSEGQSAVFDRPPPGVRKIVISTNIAETGVTIPDITCVIDSGKHREMRYDEKRQISRLIETYIAKSNAKQRRGRAGRVQEGLAFHLFTRARHDTQLADHPIPEMLRLSLQDLALRIKILRVKLGNTVEEVLNRALDPPSSTNIQRAVAALVEVKALTSNEEITPMGRLLSKLPMDVHLGKFLLVAALFKCLDPALTIAATLNSKSPFVTPFGLEAQADAAKRGFAVANSDFLTIANVFSSWRRASDNNTGFIKVFCKKNFVSHQNLQQIEELRQQLLAYLVDSGFVEASTQEKNEIAQARYSRGFRTKFVSVPYQLNVNSENVHVLGAALGAGLYPKLLAIEPSGLRTINNQQTVSIHPSSINFRIPKSEWSMTNHLVYFTLMQSKRLYAWETGPVDDRALVLLCGDLVDWKLSSGGAAVHLDKKVRYKADGKTMIALKWLRVGLGEAMSVRMRGKVMSERQKKWFDLGLDCLSVGVYQEEVVSIGVV